MIHKQPHNPTKQEQDERIRFLSQQLSTIWIAYQLLEVAEISNSAGLIMIDEMVEKLRRVEYESIELGDRIETMGRKICKVIRKWKHHDGSESFYNVQVDKENGEWLDSKDEDIYVNFSNYLKIVSKYKAEEN